MPDWMRKLSDESRSARDREEAVRERDTVARAAIEAASPQLGKDLREELVIAAEFLPDVAGLGGKVEDLPGQMLQVRVWRLGKIPGQTCTNVAYLPSGFRCFPLNGDPWMFAFCFSEGKGVWLLDQGTGEGPLDAKSAAELILRRTMRELQL